MSDEKSERRRQLEQTPLHDLVVLLHERHDENDRWRAKVDERLEEGDRQFRLLQADVSIAFNWMREIALTRNRDDVAAQIDRRIEERANGSRPDLREEDTNPGND